MTHTCEIDGNAFDVQLMQHEWLCMHCRLTLAQLTLLTASQSKGTHPE